MRRVNILKLLLMASVLFVELAGYKVADYDDDDVAILVPSVTQFFSSNSTTKWRQQIATVTRNYQQTARPRHPFLYKPDYKDWLGLKGGTSSHKRDVPRMNLSHHPIRHHRIAFESLAHGENTRWLSFRRFDG